jgi:hypothetical protein
VRIVAATVTIEASPTAVWAVLTDFASYPRWNPLFSRAAGDIVVGQRIELTTVQPGGRTMTVRPVILAADPGAELRWTAGLKGLIGGELCWPATLRGRWKAAPSLLARASLVSPGAAAASSGRSDSPR